MTLTQIHRAARLKTVLGDGFALRSFTCSEGLSVPFDMDLTALSEDRDIDLKDLLGTDCTVTYLAEGRDPVHFSGVIVEASLVATESAGHVYRVRARPAVSARLDASPEIEMFQDMSAKEIVRELLSRAGVAFDMDDWAAEGERRTYCVQYLESRFAFISRLMEQEGAFYFHEHADGSHVMKIADGNGAFRELPNYAEVPFFPPGHEGERERDHLSEWVPSRRRLLQGVKLRDYDFEEPLVREAEKPRRRRRRARRRRGGRLPRRNGRRRRPRPVRPHTARVGERAAPRRVGVGRRLRPARRRQVQADPARPGERERRLLRDRGAARDPRRYLHRRRGRPGRPARPRRDLVCPADLPFRAPMRTPRPRILGPQTAKVTGRDGEEIDVDEHGRILVRFHWDFASKYQDSTASCRIRVAQSLAGGGWGAVFLPRVGQEVVVEFLDGDPDRPIVTGVVYNGEKTPPYALPANKTRSTIKTDSSKGGGGFNELRFEDKKGSEEIYVHAQKDMNVVVEDARTKTIKKGDETIKLEMGSRSTTLDKGSDTYKLAMGDRTSTLDMGNDALTLKMGNQTTKLDLGKSETEALQSIEFKVGANSIKIDQTGVTIKGLMINLEANLNASIKANLLTQVEGSVTLILKGGVTTLIN